MGKDRRKRSFMFVHSFMLISVMTAGAVFCHVTLFFGFLAFL
jgi:hypothetical protein